MINIEILKDEIKKHKIISFDIFDTLIKRNVQNPHDIFSLVEIQYNKIYTNTTISNFREKRIAAEKQARKLNDNEEITFNEIYKLLPYSQPVIEHLKQLELNIEQSLLTPNKEIKEIYEYALSQNKIIAIISDIYLSQNFIEAQLRSCGYSKYDHLYISSSKKLTKSSGNLYRLFLKETGYSAKDILHIGDNWKSDYIKPIFLQLHAYHVNRKQQNCLYSTPKSDEFASCILHNFLNNNHKKDYFYQIGYETFGPILFGFCKWLHQYKTSLELEKLLFLSRDGQIIYKAYSMLYPEDKAQYIYVSRRSLTVPFIWKQKTLEDILNIIPVYQFNNEIQVLIDRLGLRYTDYQSTITKCGLKKDDVLHKKDITKDSRFLALYEYLKEDIFNNSLEEYKDLVSYINSLNLNKNIGIVDIGWGGTIQSMLNKILSELNNHVKITGFYYGLTKNKENAYAYLFTPQKPNLMIPIKAFMGLFELFFSANHGSVKRYINGIPQFYEFEFEKDIKARTDYQILTKIQKGAVCFIKEFKLSGINQYIQLSPQIAFNNMYRLGIYPHRKEVKLLGDLYFFDNKTDFLAHPHLKFLFQPKKLKKEIMTTGWKIGYLKRLLFIPLPYLYFYHLSKRLSTKKNKTN